MGAVAERAVAAVFATAEVNRAGLFSLERFRSKAAAAVRAVAKRLALALAARAPEIGFPGFDDDRIRSLLRNDGVAHDLWCS